MLKDSARRTRVGDFALVGGMAFLAGATDVYGLDWLGNLFVSFMSGNTTLFGRSLGSGDLGHAAVTAGIVGLFIAGAAAGAALAEWSGSWRNPAVAAAVTALLLVPSIRPGLSSAAAVLAMGMLNASFSHVGDTSVSLTYATGTLVKFSQGLGRRLCGKGGGWSWTIQGAMWICLLTGALAATLAQRWLGKGVSWPLPVVAAILTIGSFTRR